MSASGKELVWYSAFKTAMDFLHYGDLDTLEVYDIIRIMWVNSLICDSDAKFMLKDLLDYHADFDLVPHPKISAFFELLGDY